MFQKFLFLALTVSALVLGIAGHPQQLNSPRYEKFGQVVFLGDSITDWFDSEGLSVWNGHYAQLGAKNTGVSGDRTSTIITRITTQGIIDNLNAYVAVLKIGTNDISGGIPEADVVQNIGTILNLIKERNQGVRIVLLGILPRNNAGLHEKIRAVNLGIADYASDAQITFLDMESQFADGLGIVKPDLFTDGLHLSLKGYQVWADTMNSVFHTALYSPFNGKAVFLGDSITIGFTNVGKPIWDIFYKPLNSTNTGVGGHTTAQTIARIENEGILDNINSKVAVLMIGTNDLRLNVPEDTVVANTRRILDLILNRLPHVRIILLGILPRGQLEIAEKVERVNNRTAAFDNGDTITFLNMTDHFQTSVGNPIPELYNPDLVHLLLAGYDKWNQLMYPLFARLLAFN